MYLFFIHKVTFFLWLLLKSFSNFVYYVLSLFHSLHGLSFTGLLRSWVEFPSNLEKLWSLFLQISIHFFPFGTPITWLLYTVPSVSNTIFSSVFLPSLSSAFWIVYCYGFMLTDIFFCSSYPDVDVIQYTFHFEYCIINSDLYKVQYGLFYIFSFSPYHPSMFLSILNI